MLYFFEELLLLSSLNRFIDFLCDKIHCTRNKSVVVKKKLRKFITSYIMSKNPMFFQGLKLKKIRPI
jgi:hypothetical protein